MTRLAQLTFALLVCATFAAFFVTQRLKRSPLVVRQRTVTSVFSPNGDGHRDIASIRIQLKRSDDVTLSILDRDGNAVRRLASDRREPGRQPLQFFWNGRGDGGRVVRDGVYHVRVGLREQGRSVTLRATIEVHNTPPRPTVTVVAPGGSGAALFPAPGVSAIEVRTGLPLYARPRFQVYRTDQGSPRLVYEFYGDGATGAGRWDGRLKGVPAPAGTYAIAVRTIDRVSNLGVSYPIGPATQHGSAGRPGVTIRYLAATVSLSALQPGAAAAVAIANARGGRYSWRLLRPGAPKPLARGASTAHALHLSPPRQPAGVDLVEVRSGAERTFAPLVVAASRRWPVLLVLPAATWQGRNQQDDDGDGLPNTLDRGAAAAIERPFAGNGLPPGFAAHEQQLLAYLDQARLRYELTTDLALAAGTGPRLAGHRGIVLAGDERWLPQDLGARLARYVRGGGRVLSLGTDSLRRSVRLEGGRLSAPSSPAAVDALGDRVDPLRSNTADLLAFHADRIGLFGGTDGLFSGFQRSELSASLENGAQVLAGAGAEEGKPVIMAYRLGSGLVIRTGLPEWSSRLRGDPNVDAVTRRAWRLLSR